MSCVFYKTQEAMDAAVSAEQARKDVDRERKASEDRQKEHPQPDGFINDYD